MPDNPDSAANGTSSLSSFWRAVGTFIAPTTTVAALLLYFGWVRASTTYAYFGVDVERTLGLSASDYIRRSSTVIFTPFAVLLLITVAVLLGYRLADKYLTQPDHYQYLRRLAVGIGIVATAAMVIATIFVIDIDLFAKRPLVKPLSLGIAVLLASYASHLHGLVVDLPLTRNGGRPMVTVLYLGVLGSLAMLALFWAASIVAVNQGRSVAHRIENDLNNRTGAVIYSHDILFISGPGVKFTVLDPTASAFRFRYTGLRFLARTADGGYLLLPRGWTHTNGNPAYILPLTGIRVDLQALPAD